MKATISRYASIEYRAQVGVRFRPAASILIKIGDVKLRERYTLRWQKKSDLVASLPGGKVTVNLIEHIL